jgi:DNA-binding NarL/FixJ family response regulator
MKRPGTWSRRWTRLVAHVASGERLRRSTSRDAAIARAEAVLAADGSVLSATGPAVVQRARIRDEARSIDRSRGRLRRRDPDAALDAWQALVAGRWSLVDHFDSDGKRFVLALPNEPGTSDPRGLAFEERALLGYVTLGHSNKRIAYELGLPEGTVARRVANIARKLGVRSRVGIIDRYVALRDADVVAIDAGGAPLIVAVGKQRERPLETSLTAAELDVARLAARGASNKAIAARRRSSIRTVEHLVAAVYRKLGIASRAELAVQMHARSESEREREGA